MPLQPLCGNSSERLPRYPVEHLISFVLNIMNQDAVGKIGMALPALPFHVKIIYFASFRARSQADQLKRLIVITEKCNWFAVTKPARQFPANDESFIFGDIHTMVIVDRKLAAIFKFDVEQRLHPFLVMESLDHGCREYLPGVLVPRQDRVPNLDTVDGLVVSTCHHNRRARDEATAAAYALPA